MTVSLGSSLALEGFLNYFFDLWEAQPCLWDLEWHRDDKVYLPDLTLAYILDHAVCWKFELSEPFSVN